jgi:uncharacterized protein Yka (UPF0111/DUF47 family)
VRWFLPKNEDFLQFFDEASANVVRGTAALRDLLKDPSDLKAKVEALREIEHEGDRITHKTMDKLNSSFITPFDREDIHGLISRMDDILDAANGAAQRIVLYRIDEIPARLLALSELLVASSEEVRKAVVALPDRRKHPAALKACVEVNRLENEGDALHREALADMFATFTDAIALVKLKEVYLLLEEATDRCEDVANVVEGIIIKSS